MSSKLVSLFLIGIIIALILKATPVRAILSPSLISQVVASVPYQPQGVMEEGAVQAYLSYANRDPNQVPTIVTGAVVVDSYALLNWEYSQMAGQVVLVKQGEQWQILRGTGGLLGVSFMVNNGVPETIAQMLWDAYLQQQGGLY